MLPQKKFLGKTLKELAAKFKPFSRPVRQKWNDDIFKVIAGHYFCFKSSLSPSLILQVRSVLS